MPEKTWATIRQKLNSYLDLKPNWNSYGADNPRETTVTDALIFIYLLHVTHIPAKIVKVAPSVMGGIGITIRGTNRSVFVEFCNTTKNQVVFYVGFTEPKIQEFSFKNYADVIISILDYLEMDTHD